MRAVAEIGVSADSDTREQIFLAAEKLFAERGYDGVSVRDIVAAANVNLAAINYHFGSKGELLLEIFRRRARELNKERQRLLRQAGDDLEQILHALLAPPILWRAPDSGRAIASRFMNRAMTESTPELRLLLETDVRHQRMFLAALQRALPGWRTPELCWALHFVNGLAHICTDTNFKRLNCLSDAACDTEDLDAILARAVRFGLNGVRALADIPPKKDLI
jgi:AcrR family transcriptional regulator